MDQNQKFAVVKKSNINFLSNLRHALPQLLRDEKFVDVTLSCEGNKFKCHRLVLAASSPLFEDLFTGNDYSHPILIMPSEIKTWELLAVIDYMYKGSVDLSYDGLQDFMRTAKMLQIRGLYDAPGSLSDRVINDDSFISIPDSPEPSQESTSPFQNNNEHFLNNNIQQSQTETNESYICSNEEDTGEFKEWASAEIESHESNLDMEEEEDSDNHSKQSTTSMPGLPVLIPFSLMNKRLTNNNGIFMQGNAGELKKKAPTRSEVQDQEENELTPNEVILRKPSGNRPRAYDATALYNALMAVKDGKSIYRAALEQQVPRKTLRNWMKRLHIKSQFPMPGPLKNAAIKKRRLPQRGKPDD